MPRTSIHFYLREGLLPQPHKTGVNRALYTENHVRVLRRIRELKEAGLSLAEIRSALQDILTNIEVDDPDLVARENERVRKNILRVATEEFMAKGYEHARVADIIRKAGVTSQVFYTHFPSKAELLVESFKTFISWNLAFVEPKLSMADPGERVLWRVLANARANALGSSVLSVIRSETPNGSDLTTLVEQAWAPIVSYVVSDLESALPPGATTSASLELLAYSLVGAIHNASLRASWDDTFSPEDVVTTHLWMYLAVWAALSGEVDIDSRVARYRDLIKEVAARKPQSPPPPGE